MKYSFIIPVYNSEKYIERCLLSILNQKCGKINFEIIVINDGSTDNSEQIIFRIMETYLQKINYYKQNRLGVSVARNKGIIESQGEYIVFIDSDDMLAKNFFVNNNDIVNSGKYDIIKNRVRCIENNLNNNRFDVPFFYNMSGEQALTLFCNSNKIFATPWSYIIRKELMIKNKLYFTPDRLHEDYGLIPIVISKSKKVASLDYYGYIYIKRPNSLVTTSDIRSEINRFNDFVYHSNNLINYFKTVNDFSDENKIIICKYFCERLKIKRNNLVKKGVLPNGKYRIVTKLL